MEAIYNADANLAIFHSIHADQHLFHCGLSGGSVRVLRIQIGCSLLAGGECLISFFVCQVLPQAILNHSQKKSVNALLLQRPARRLMIAKKMRLNKVVLTV